MEHLGSFEIIYAGLVNTWPGLLSLNPVGHYNLCRGVVVLESVSDLICLTGGFYETLREPGGSWVLNKSFEYNKTALFPNVSLLLNRTEIKPALPSQRVWIINQSECEAEGGSPETRGTSKLCTFEITAPDLALERNYRNDCFSVRAYACVCLRARCHRRKDRPITTEQLWGSVKC